MTQEQEQMHRTILNCAVFVLALLLAGCASQSGNNSGSNVPRILACFAAGAVIGGAAGNLVAGDDEDAAVAISGLAVGAAAAEACNRWLAARAEPPPEPPIPDSDGDGVNDRDDRCPDSHPQEIVDALGCPKDSDGDGVPDRLDRCPDTNPGIKVDEDGCAQIGEIMATVKGPIFFDFDRSEIKSEAGAKLSRLGKVLRDNPRIQLDVVGHTDNRGNERYNMALGQQRAESAQRYLVEQEGIAAERLKVKSMGESAPVASNETAEGQAENRRVEFVVNGKS